MTHVLQVESNNSLRGLETKWNLDQGYILLIWKVLDRRDKELGSIDVIVLGPAK